MSKSSHLLLGLSVMLLAYLSTVPASAVTSDSAASARQTVTVEAVPLKDGQVSGSRRNGVSSFLGIPYAAPPVGANRWRAPQPVSAWQGDRAATHFAPSCWQAVDPHGFGPWTHEYVVSGAVSEDCLYLNVWSSVARGARRPVLVWIYGGGFNSGSGSVAVYDGSALAAQGIVVVNFNYRVGVLGFLAHPDLTREARIDGTPPGNYGLQDQLAALRWVRDNIAAFGGDPGAVTIAGQSAGAMSVDVLIDSPLAKGLFRGAIAESGLLSTLQLLPLADAERAGQDLAHKLGAVSMKALRALPPQQLAATGPAAPRFAPISDGVLVTDPAHPDLNDTPLLVGMNTNDPGSFGPAPSPSATAVAKLLHSSYGTLAARFAPLYPVSTTAEQAAALREVARDRGLAALYAFSRARLSRSRQPLYVYLFDHAEPGPQSALYGAFHSAELPYVFKTLDAAPERGFTAQDRDLANMISSYWLGFVRTGVPATPGLPRWPRMKVDTPEILQFTDHPHSRPILPRKTLEAVDAFLASGGMPRLF